MIGPGKRALVWDSGDLSSSHCSSTGSLCDTGQVYLTCPKVITALFYLKGGVVRVKIVRCSDMGALDFAPASKRFAVNFLTLFFSSTEVDDMIRKSTNLLLTRMLSNCLQNVIKRRNTGLTEVRTSVPAEKLVMARDCVQSSDVCRSV